MRPKNLVRTGLAILALAFLLVPPGAQTPVAAQTRRPTPYFHRITISDQGIDLPSVSCLTGDTVEWDNHTAEVLHVIGGDPTRAYLPLLSRGEPASGTVWAGTVSAPRAPLAAGGRLAAWSGEIQPGGTFSLTFATPGVYPYFIAEHPTWTGRLLVVMPGLTIQGRVLFGGNGLAGVQICRTYASYPGELVATTDPDGWYQSAFAYIPGDETVTVWAFAPGYSFVPNKYIWEHYLGIEVKTANFIAQPGGTSPSCARPPFSRVAGGSIREP
jgi:plastocyanin